ncbi:MAG: hypothetical protein HZA17_12465 [Nitrospirae bacterium]|nr:hypothetical protein [Nitrospirota bacterium]
MERKKVLLVLLIVLFTALWFSQPLKSDAGVNVNIGINVPLPHFVISAPPHLVFIPGTYAYFVPDIDVDILFYHGYWYRPHEGRWYRARGYNGPWAYTPSHRVPRPLMQLPPDYRIAPPGHERIPYGQLRKKWRTWERDKYWDRHDRGEMQRERMHEERERHKEDRHRHKEDRGRGRY